MENAMEPADFGKFSRKSSVSVVDEVQAVGMRCPKCRRDGTFTDSAGTKDVRISMPWADPSKRDQHVSISFGNRFCPNPECQCHVFVVHESGRLLESHPPELIDFDTADMPAKIVRAFEEAIACHAHGCYVASAMLVRKTFEELCAEKEAKGESLQNRIESLRQIISLPETFFAGIHNLRLLGNDATHVEARTYDDISRKESELGIKAAREILRVCYQTPGIIEGLEALKTKRAQADLPPPTK